MRKQGHVIWGFILLLLTLGLAGCVPSMGEPVLPQPAAASPPPTTVPVVALVPPPIPHNVEGARRNCLLCHAAGAVEAPAVPADSDHEDPVELCSTCHALLPESVPPSTAPPPITHDLVGREECLMCHKMGIGYAPRIPENHEALPVDLCQTCHSPGPGEVRREETPVAGLTPPQVPHPLEDRTDCRLCHETGVGDAPQFPADHADRANEVCSVCHSLSLAEEAPATAVAPPQVPHPVENRTDCRLCHETGVGDAPEFPDDHADRGNEVCLVCHLVVAPQETPTSTDAGGAEPPLIPHSLENRGDCRLCHESGLGGAPQFPADHAGRANEVCLVCHGLAAREERLTGVEEDEDDDEPPSVPHSLENRNDCRLCHESGVGGASEFPGDHADYENEVCQVCHEPGT